MEIFTVMQIVKHRDGTTDRFIAGVYSSRENAINAVKDYQYTSFDSGVYGKLIDEDVCDGDYCCARIFYTDNNSLEWVMLTINKPIYILDDPISRNPLLWCC